MLFPWYVICYCLVTTSCLTLCDIMAYNPPGSSVQGIFQARILAWVAISFSRGLPDLGCGHMSPAWQADSLPLSHQGRPDVYKTCTVVQEHITEPAETWEQVCKDVRWRSASGSQKCENKINPTHHTRAINETTAVNHLSTSNGQYPVF